VEKTQYRLMKHLRSRIFSCDQVCWLLQFSATVEKVKPMLGI